MANDEEEIYSQFSKLYHFVSTASGNKWVMSGTGEAKLLKHRKTGQVRFMLQQEKTMKVLSNHLVTDVPPYCDLLPNANGDTCWVWTAQDFADDQMKIEKLALKFGDREKAMFFQTKFENAKRLNKGASTAHERHDHGDRVPRYAQPDVLRVVQAAEVEKRHQTDAEMSQLRARLKTKDAAANDAERLCRGLEEANAELKIKLEAATRKATEANLDKARMEEQTSQMKTRVEQTQYAYREREAQIRDLSAKVEVLEALLAKQAPQKEANIMAAEVARQQEQMWLKTAEDQRRAGVRAEEARRQIVEEERRQLDRRYQAENRFFERVQEVRFANQPDDLKLHDLLLAIAEATKLGIDTSEAQTLFSEKQEALTKAKQMAAEGARQQEQMRTKPARHQQRVSLRAGKIRREFVGGARGVITEFDGFRAAHVENQADDVRVKTHLCRKLTNAPDQHPSTLKFHPVSRQRSTSVPHARKSANQHCRRIEKADSNFSGTWANSSGGIVIITLFDNGILTVDVTHTGNHYDVLMDHFWDGSRVHLRNHRGRIDCWPPTRITWDNGSSWTWMHEGSISAPHLRGSANQHCYRNEEAGFNFTGTWANSSGGKVIITLLDNGILRVAVTLTGNHYDVFMDHFWDGSELHLRNHRGRIDCWPPTRITWTNGSEWTWMGEGHGKSRGTGSLWR